MNRDDYTPNPNLPTAADRKPGPYAFVRSASEIVADQRNQAADLRDERADNTIWDRD